MMRVKIVNEDTSRYLKCETYETDSDRPYASVTVGPKQETTAWMYFGRRIEIVEVSPNGAA